MGVASGSDHRRHLRASLALLICSVLALPLSANARTETAAVRHVIDGDTVVLRDNRTVRLVGINAPERGRGGAPDEPFYAAAHQRLKALVENKTVTLEYEDEGQDRHGRTLAHLIVDGVSVESILIKEGLVTAVAVPPNVREAVRLFAVEREARAARRGLWGHAASTPQTAETLSASDTGYRFVRGTVTRIGNSRKAYYLDMGPRFAVRISHVDWARHFRNRPEDWKGKRLLVRGWVSEHESRLHLNAGHPLMIEQLP